MCVVGDAAVALLKAGAETDKPDLSGKLALDLAPDKEVSPHIRWSHVSHVPASWLTRHRSRNTYSGWRKTKASTYDRQRRSRI